MIQAAEKVEARWGDYRLLALELFPSAIPRRVRGYREFAESEVVIPNGPHAGERFCCDTLPYTGLLLDALDSGQWTTHYITGPTQSGKTLTAFAIPLLHTVAELRETTIMAVPEADMANDKWTQDIVPILESSPSLSGLRPKTGPGSKGGAVKDLVRLGNDVYIKIMSRGGQDTAKAGFTSRTMALTEAAGFSETSETSSESDPLRQLKGRLRAFSRSERRVIVEGTVTTESELPWRAKKAEDPEVIISTESRIVSPCPHCGAWISPEREHFVGWDVAKSDQEAMDLGHFVCPLCGHAITEEERRASNRDNRLLHRGQTIGTDGAIVGDLPRTSTLWFRWSAWNNLLSPMADLAADEWESAQAMEGTEDRDNAEKQQCQQVWCIPYEADYDTDHLHLEPRKMRRRRAEWPVNVLPEDTTHLSVGIDIGKWTCWYVVLAGRENKTVHVPAYGAITVMLRNEEEAEDTMRSIMSALNGLYDEQLEPGWGGRVADRVLVDAGYSPKDKSASAIPISVAAEFCRGKEGYFPAYGRGQSMWRKQVYRHPQEKTMKIRRIGDKAPYYVERNYDTRCSQIMFDADWSKLWFQGRFVIADKTSPGAITLYASPDVKEHSQLCAHIANERYKFDPKKRENVWTKTGQNHLLDCGAMASIGLFDAGFDLSDGSKPQPARNKWWGR